MFQYRIGCALKYHVCHKETVVVAAAVAVVIGVLVLVLVLIFNSIQFNRYLLTCRLNSTSANYKASTKAQIEYKTVQIHKTKH
jgi:hypothetical protein